MHSSVFLPTSQGDFLISTLDNHNEVTNPHIILKSQRAIINPPLIRIHSECMTGDCFGSLRCDCGAQLHFALNKIALHSGYLFYLRQEGRGIGLTEKLKAYQLQDAGEDTVTANLKLGHQADTREYSAVVHYLLLNKIRAVRILSNNPDKINYLESHGIQIIERIPIIIPASKHSKDYLDTKKNKMGHYL